MSVATPSGNQAAIDALNAAGPTVDDTLEGEIESFLKGENTTNNNRATDEICSPDDLPVGIYNQELQVLPSSQIQYGEGFVWYSEVFTGTGANWVGKGIIIPQGYRFKLIGFMLDQQGASNAPCQGIVILPSSSIAAFVAADGNGFAVPCITIQSAPSINLASLGAGQTIPGGFAIVPFANAQPVQKVIATIYGSLTKDDNTRNERADAWV